eukprot:ANDGO_08333.mRNA.1 variant
MIQGDCAAGRICYKSSDTPLPSFGDSRGDLCPLGHYCLAGTVTPTACTNDTVNSNLGGSVPADCVPCPAGFTCVPGNPVPTPCVPGYYCEINKSPVPCPPKTFNARNSATDASYCLPCPDSYYCPVSGISVYQVYPCPPGSYCFNATTTPEPCPAGTYRPIGLGGNPKNDCLVCPQGQYCPNAGMVSPLNCPAKYYCPSGSSSPQTCLAGGYCPANSGSSVMCPAGYFCPNGTDNPTLCPAGYYCPNGTNSIILCGAGFYCPNGTGPLPITCPAGSYCSQGVFLPTACPLGSYCPAGSSAPTLCPLGYFGTAGVSFRGTSAASCTICPPGTYGAKSDRTECLVCPAGYICLGGTTSAAPTDEILQKGRQCRTGTYCPAGSSSETYCPAGTFNPTAGSSSADACLSCAANSYTPKVGMSACLPCGASASSIVGSSTCVCVGQNRIFLPTTGSCLCKPYHVFYDGNLKERDEDSTLDCVPRVYEDCNKYESSRDAVDGSCKSSGSDCSYCPTKSGKFDRSLGMCACDGTTEADDVCDSVCRASQPTVTYDSTNNQFTLKMSNGTQVTYSASHMPGKISCPHSVSSGKTCTVRTLQSLSTGTRGVLAPSLTYLDAALGAPLTSLSTSSVSLQSAFASSNLSTTAFSGRNGLITTAASSVPQTGLDSPIMCLELGDSLLWSISSSTNYPVYLPDSLLNTVSNFDYGAFLELQSRMRSGSSTVSSFSFTFTTAGTYTFADAGDTSKLTLVVVMSSTQSCPSTSSNVMAMTPTNAVLYGVTRNDDVSTPPDWILIGVVLAGIVVIVGVTVAACFYVRRSKAADSEYKRLGEDLVVPQSIGSTKTLVADEEGGDSREVQLLEDFNVKTFYDKLEDSTIHMMSQIANSNLQGLQMYRGILDETEKIKNLLANQLHAKDDPSVSVSGTPRPGQEGKAVQLELPKAFTDSMTLFLKTQLEDMGITPLSVHELQRDSKKRRRSTATGLAVPLGKKKAARRSSKEASGGDSDDEATVEERDADSDEMEFFSGEEFGASGSLTARRKNRPSSGAGQRPSSGHRRKGSMRRLSDGAMSESPRSAKTNAKWGMGTSLSMSLYDEEDVAFEEVDENDVDMDTVLGEYYETDFADWLSESAPPEKERQVMDLERRLVQRQRRLEKRHIAERADLEAQIDYEEREAGNALSRQIDAQRQTIVSHLEEEMEMLKSRLDAKNAPESQRKAEMERLASQHAQILEQLEEDSRNSRVELSSRFSARRDERFAALQKQHASEIDLERAGATTERDELSKFLMSAASSEIEKQRWDDQRRTLEQRIAGRKARRDRELDEEVRRVDEEASVEEQAAISFVEVQLERMSDAQVHALESLRASDLQSARSEIERRRIMDDYAREFEELEAALEYERERQLQNARDRIESERRKKDSHIRRRHAEKVEADLVEDRKELDDLVHSSMGAVQRLLNSDSADVLASRLDDEEKRLLTKSAERIDAQQAERAAKLQSDLDQKLATLEQQFAQKSRSKSVDLSALEAEKEAEKRRLLDEFESESKSLEDSAASERARQKERIERKMAQQRAKVAVRRKKELEEQEASLAAARTAAAAAAAAKFASQTGGAGAAPVVSSVDMNTGFVADAEIQRLVEQLEADSGLSSDSRSVESSYVPVFDSHSSSATASNAQNSVVMEVDADLDTWHDRESDAIDEAISSLRKVEVERIKAHYGSLLSRVDDEDEKRRLMDLFTAELEALGDSLDRERRRQRALLTERVQNRRALALASQVGGQEAVDVLEAAKLLRDMDDNMAAAQQQGESQLADYLHKLRDKEIAKKKKKRDDALAKLASQHLGPDQTASAREAILAQYDAELGALEASLDSERVRQRSKLSEKLAQRRSQLVAKHSGKSNLLKDWMDASEESAEADKAAEQRSLLDIEAEVGSERARRLRVLSQNRDVLLRNADSEKEVRSILEDYERSVADLAEECDKERAAQLARMHQLLAAKRGARMAHESRLKCSANSSDPTSLSEGDRELLSELSIDEMQAAESVESGIEKIRTSKLADLRKKRDQSMESAYSSAERDRILKEFDSAVAKLDDEIHRERDRQLAEAVKRRQKKAATLQKRAGHVSVSHDPLDSEEVALRSEIQKALDHQKDETLRSLKLHRDAELSQAALSTNLDEQQRIMAQFDLECASLENNLDSERARQFAQLAQTMATRKLRAAKSAALVSSLRKDDLSDADNVLAQIEALERDDQRMAEQVIGASLRAEETAGIATIQAQLEVDRRAKLQHAQSKMQESLAGADSEAEKRRIMDEYVRAVAALDDQLDVEKARQEAKLAERLARKKAELRDRQEKARFSMMNAVVNGSVTRELSVAMDSQIGAARTAMEKKVATVSSADEKERIMREYEDTVASLESELDLEREKQMLKMKEKLSKRAAQVQNTPSKKKDAGKESNVLAALAAREEEQAALLRLEKHKSAEIARQKEVLDSQLRDAANEDEKARLLSEHSANVNRLEEQLDLERQKQKDAISLRLNAKKKASEGKSKQQQALADEEFKKLEIELKRKSEESLESQKRTELAKARREMEQQLTAETSDAEKHRIMKAYEEEAKRLESSLDEEKDRQRTVISEKMSARKARADAKKRATEEAERHRLAKDKEEEEALEKARREKESRDAAAREERKKLAQAKRDAISAATVADPELVKAQQAELATMMAEHEAEAARVASSIGAEEDRQKADLQKKLEEKKKKKQEMLQKKHAAETSLALEKQALMDAIAAGKIPEDKAREVIRAMLARRHAREMEDLASEQDAQIQSRLNEIAKLHDDAQVRSEKQAAARQWLEMQHAEERLALRQRHSKEITDAVSMVRDPLAQMEEQFLQQQEHQRKVKEAEAAKRASEIEILQKSLERERDEMRLAAAAERQRIENEQKETMQREMAALDAELDAERARMEKGIEDERRRRQLAMEQLRLQKEKEKAEELALQGELQEQQRKELLENHAKEINTLVSALDVERAKQEDALRKKLSEKQDRKRTKRQKEMDEKVAMEKALEREREASRRRLEHEAEKEWHSKLQKQQSTVMLAVSKLKRTVAAKPADAASSGTVRSDAGDARPSLLQRSLSNKQLLPRSAVTSTVLMSPPQSMDTVTKFFQLPPEEQLFDLLRRSPLFVKLCAVDEKLSSLSAEWQKTRETELKGASDVDLVIHEIRERLAAIVPPPSA